MNGAVIQTEHRIARLVRGFALRQIELVEAVLRLVALPVGFYPLVIRYGALGLCGEAVLEKVVVHYGVAGLCGLVDVGARDGFQRVIIGAGFWQRDVLDCGCHVLFGGPVFAARPDGSSSGFGFHCLATLCKYLKK